MAIAIIGGLTTSTLLTLIVVPVLFTYIDKMQHFVFARLLKGPAQRRSREQAAEELSQNLP